MIPKNHAGPLRPSLYGHGLLGGAGEVTGGNIRAMANEHGFVFCATDWTGMSTLDVPNVLTLLQDLSRFPTLADRAQQGFLNFMYVGRWMLKHDWGEVPVDQSALFYDGNSQGGIMGGALTALAPDFQRAVLGVPGMNYSTLLRRSVDFDMYAKGEIEGVDTPAGLYDSYPNELERPLLLSLIQLLWDRGEANGYAHHMTVRPAAGHAAARGAPARGLRRPPGGGRDGRGGGADDRRVGALARARAGAAHERRPVLRHPADRDAIRIRGSALVLWDTGVPAPPTTNTPPREGKDPHSAPRNSPAARRQKSEFLRVNGTVVDVCDGAALRSLTVLLPGRSGRALPRSSCSAATTRRATARSTSRTTPGRTRRTARRSSSRARRRATAT